ncbi:doxx family protein [uncultured Maribacter sp.]|uniref:doxx family protein n=1 Tax=uncultured Maribacter sp. TaxID=431308 RepID=UPI0030DD007D|tara:strand:+ start:1809 stop:2237 length:429 start_codon:yes stop_codon:yes gene_type:complete
MNFNNFKITNRKGNTLLSIAIGIIYLWFGALKFFPELSPAEDLAKRTIQILTFNIIPSSISIIILAFMEVVIGLCLIFKFCHKQIVIIAILHIILTFSPLFFFTEESFTKNILTPTLLGQYIGKNLIIIAALFTILKENVKA